MDALTPLGITAVVSVLAAARGAERRRHALAQAKARARRARPRRPVPATPTAMPPVSPAQAWSAAERAGWRELLDSGQLRQVAAADDPGNPGQRLVLVDHPAGGFGPVRALLATDPTPGPDGTRPTVALPVPDTFTDPVAVAAWTYHDPDHPLPTTTASYAALARRA